ncbi:ParA family protein [Nocardia altamirensis]|uniref:ParA family protein n=1 Tax=Nocardia altamirensis TaxID=472158 RepID=UPI0008401D77|nr:ParA family protein [Nocardia altamirensis]
MTEQSLADECTICTGLSGKGGASKSFMKWLLASAASTEDIPTLLIDLDPEANMTQGLSQSLPHLMSAPGIGDALMEAGALWAQDGDDYDIAKGAAKLVEVITPSTLPGVDFIPAGKQLQAVGAGQLRGSDWGRLLSNLIDAAGFRERYRLILIDTAGRRGHLVTLAMYASDVAFSPINGLSQAVKKAIEARARVEAIQKAHPLRWAGVVLTGIDVTRNTAVNHLIRQDAAEAFGAELHPEDGTFVEWGQVIQEIPYRPALLHQVFELKERLSDQPGAQARDLSKMMSDILHKHILTSAGREHRV